jgi:hypothetical protein
LVYLVEALHRKALNTEDTGDAEDAEETIDPLYMPAFAPAEALSLLKQKT